MENLERYLAEHPFFTGMKPEHIAVLVGCASNARYNVGEYIDRAGEEANAFFIIRSGRAAVEAHHPTAGPILIQTVGEGEVVGWSWMVPPYVGHFDTRAIELTRATSLDAKCLRRKCDEDPELGYELFKRFVQIIEQRLEGARMQLLDIYK